MKSFKVRVVTDVLISFDDDAATPDDAEHVAADCLNSRAQIGASGLSKRGRWEVRPILREVTKVKKEGEDA